ncbi:MAG: VOC family protein [Candidatus Dadabacteria bacterium]|nr:MAG: VOC family protein [Candidatus Dadabacteria bacterium]
MIRGIHHTAISTGDLDRLLGFYRDLLGLEVIADFSWPSGFEVADAITGLEGSSARAVMLRAGNACIELFQYQNPTPKPGDPDRPVCDHGITHVCLDVVDLDSEYERLRAAGVRFHCPPQDLGGGVKTTYARDPDGNVVELQEVSDPSHPIAVFK